MWDLHLEVYELVTDAAKEHAPSSIALADAFSRFGAAFMHWTKGSVRQEGLTFARMRVLWELELQGSQIMTNLKDALSITARSLTSLIDGLEEDGYVRRVPHEEDRRATVIELTEDGQEAVTRIRAAHNERAAMLFDTLSETQRGQMLGVLEELMAAFQDPAIGGVGT